MIVFRNTACSSSTNGAVAVCLMGTH
jgi:hypothetical protein